MSTKRISPNVDEEYLKCPDIKRDEIQKLQVWIQTQPHLPQLTEYELMVFYAGADYSIEATKQLIENNMACRTHFEEFFGCFDVDTPRIRKVFKTIAGFPLPKRTPAGYLVVMGKLLDTDPLNYNYNDYVKLGGYPLPKQTPDGYGVVIGKLLDKDPSNFNFTDSVKFAGYPLPQRAPGEYAVVIGKLIDKDPSNFNFTDYVKLYFLGQDIILQEIGVLPGLIFVVDLSDATFAHLTRVGLQQLKKTLYYLQEAIPIRLKSLHFINIVPFMDKILALMSPFMKKELMDILHVHASLDTFYEHVPREILPQELGGAEPHSKEMCETFYQKLRDNRLALIEYNLSRRINEKLRPGQMKNPSDIFGTAGNFKKLDID